MDQNTKYQKEFQQKGYVKVEKIIDPKVAKFIGNYGAFLSHFQTCKDDSQVPNSFVKYTDMAMEHLMVYLRDEISNKTGLEVLPTYTYYRVYGKGNELKKHKDRESCEISCTLCLNKDVNWPIHMEDSGPIELEPGDAVIYRGCDLVHWREILREEGNMVQVFLHYVEKGGPNEHFYMDRRGDIYNLMKVYGLK